MRLLRFVAVCVAIAVIGFALSGCSTGSDGDGAPTADELFASGLATLEEDMGDIDFDQNPWQWDVDMSSALEDFEDVLEQDPNHCGALLLASIARLMVIATDPDLGVILEDIFDMEGRSGTTANPLFFYLEPPKLSHLRRVAEGYRAQSRDGFPFSELQDYIEDEVIPALDYVDESLTRFEDLDCEVILEIEIGAKRDTTIILELDATDAYFVHAPLDAMQSVFHIVTSYNVDVTDEQTIQELLTTDPDFLTLRAGNHMEAAFAELEDMTDHVYDALDELVAETDDQTYDVITVSDGMYLVLEDLLEVADPVAEIEAAVDLVDDALHNPVIFNPSDEEVGAPDIDVTIVIEEIFVTPLDDIRDYFPEFSWLVPDEPEPVRPINFPYPEFDGITPGMDNAGWEEIISWLDESD
jgi:hypothetical protein